MTIPPTTPSYLDYIPDTNRLEESPKRILRLNIHFINSLDSSRNFREEEGRKFIRGLLASANKDVRENNALWLPHSKAPPKIPPRYEYKVVGRPGYPEDDGIYFHYDDALCFYRHKGQGRNLGDRLVIQRYGIQLDTVLNIFIMPFFPEDVAKPGFKPGGVGVALGSSIKMAGMFESKQPPWTFRGILNHEIGHIFGLAHAWQNDGCEDTPKHPNPCWNRSRKPPCDTAASNNFMGDNALQNAWSPCQIGRVRQKMADTNARVRAFLEPRWCEFKPEKKLEIRDTITWNGAKDLESDIFIAKDAHLIINNRISMAPGALIRIEAGGKLTLLENALLHNACGESWRGIEIRKEGRRKGAFVQSKGARIEDLPTSKQL